MARALFYLTLFVPFTLSMSLAAVVGTLIDRSGDFARCCARLWSRGGLALAGVDVAIEGAERIPAGTPVIFMGNHQSNFDILALSLALPRSFSWIAKEELFRIPLFGAAMRRAGYIPLDRSHGRKALKSMQAAAERIKNGASVVIFPEGTRSGDGRLLSFKKGGFLLAMRAGVPVVPLTINGSTAVNPGKRLELHRGTIRITISDPIRVEGAITQDELMEQVHGAIAARLD